MRAYITQVDSIEVPVEAFFHREPVSELARSNASQFLLTIAGSSPERRAERQASTGPCLTELEALRKTVVAPLTLLPMCYLKRAEPKLPQPNQLI